jgi:hypothetical protein
MLTLKRVNKAIKELGGEEVLVKGDGYYYFWEGTAPDWKSSSVMVCRLNQLTLEQWIEEYKSLKNCKN